MNRRVHTFVLVLTTLVMYGSLAVADTALEVLQATGHLSIHASLDRDKIIVPGQRVKLTLEVATDTWFTGGTRIRIPEVPGLVILQTEQFASNASERRGDDTWVIQRWTLDVYPQRAGEFTIDSLLLQIQVNAGEDGEAQGEIPVPAVHFSVAMPDSLATAGQWVASPDFTVRQSFDRDLAGLEVGDAFEQEILFEAADVPAMMLPAYEVERQPGLSAYPSPPILDNSANRGESRGSRTVRISYVAERPGEYLLGARDYFWWNTRKGELAVLSLPETRVSIAGSIGDTAPERSVYPDWRSILFALAGLLLLGIAGRVAYARIPARVGVGWKTLASRLARSWRRLRQPALATRLNPGNSAAE